MRALRTVASGLFAAGVLAGCGFSPVGVGSVSPAEVAGYYNETASDSGGISAGEYLVASISYTNEKCYEFFNKLAILKEDSKFLDEVLTAGMAAGAPLMTTFNVAAGTVAAWTAGINYTNGLNKSGSDIYLFADFKNELQPLVLREMEDFMNKKGLTTLAEDYLRNRVNTPFLVSRNTVDLMLARNLATDYASKCSLPNMRTLIASSLNKNKGDLEGGDGKNGKTSLLAPTSGAMTQ